MTRLKHSLSFLVLSAALALAPIARAAAPEPYRVVPGDALMIASSVQSQLFNASVSASNSPGYVVRSDGRISLPLLGEIAVGDMTIAEISAMLATQYRPIFGRATFAVNVSRFHPRTLSVVGEVVNPGPFEFVTLPGLDECLAKAGGPTEWAITDGIQVIRDERTIAVVDLAAVRAGRQAPPVLAERDVLFVPAHWGKGVAPYVPPLISALVGVSTLVAIWVRR